jgi:hypothetical protein
MLGSHDQRSQKNAIEIISFREMARPIALPRNRSAMMVQVNRQIISKKEVINELSKMKIVPS